jgi:hypothetical protein
VQKGYEVPYVTDEVFSGGPIKGLKVRNLSWQKNMSVCTKGRGVLEKATGVNVRHSSRRSPE